MVLEKTEREKQAIEQKKQKDQLLKERMEKIKELVRYYNKYLAGVTLGFANVAFADFFSIWLQKTVAGDNSSANIFIIKNYLNSIKGNY